MIRDPRTGAALSYEAMLVILKVLVEVTGDDPAQFGLHSPRIGGLTMHGAARVDRVSMQHLGQWATRAWMLYNRAERATLLADSARAMQARVTRAEADDFMARFLAAPQVECD